MLKFMDRFSDFYVKWFYFPIYGFYTLILFLGVWYELFDLLTSVAFFVCGLFWGAASLVYCRNIAEKHPDLKRLEDESDGK